MARLALAALLVLAVVGVLATFVAGLVSIRRAAGAGGAFDLTEGSAMQKVAFFLLICLIVYVSASGGV
jgi:hypothetical protein